MGGRASSTSVGLFFTLFFKKLMCRQTPHEGMPHFELAYEILAHNLRPEIFDFIPETFKQLMQVWCFLCLSSRVHMLLPVVLGNQGRVSAAD